MDYAAWLKRATDFTDGLRGLPGEVKVTIEVVPPLTDEQVAEIAKISPLPIPAPLKQWWTTASGHCNTEYWWNAPEHFRHQMAIAFPNWRMSHCGGGAKFESARETVELADSTIESGTSFRQQFPRDARYWEHSLPLIPVSNGDYVGLYVRENPDAPEVAYLCHDGYGASHTIAPDFDTFLRQWEQLSYIGIHFLCEFIDIETGLLEPDLFPQEVKAVAAMFRGQTRPKLAATQREMTANRWANCTHPEVLLDWLEAEKRFEPRKLRLFCCACCRRVQDRMGTSGRQAIDVSERFADGRSTKVELIAVRDALAGGVDIGTELGIVNQQMEALSHLPDSQRKSDDLELIWDSFHEKTAFSRREGLMNDAAYEAIDAHSLVCWEIYQHLDDPELRAEKAAQADLVRHIFGNPIAPAAAGGTFSTTVKKLARRIYDGERCVNELHAALRDTKHNDLAEHFREAVHPKGCWALDLILHGA